MATSIIKKQIQFGNGNNKRNEQNLATVKTKEQIQFSNGNKYYLAMVITKEQIQFGNGNDKGKNTIWQEQ